MLDWIVRGARVVDGTGAPWIRTDVGVKGDRIAAMGDLEGARAHREVDAGGDILAPGFIDVHTHSDLPLLVEGEGHSHIRQGVTTVAIGNCGNSPAPLSERGASRFREQIAVDFPELDWPPGPAGLADYLGELARRGTSSNVVPLVGHGTLRMSAMGFVGEAPGRDAMDAMKSMLAGAMEAGAFGLSSGLIYTPGSYARTPELVELARVVAAYRGIYASHIRGENDTLFDAVDEAIEIGEAAGIPVQIARLKVMGRHMWGSADRLLEVIEGARERGIDVTADQYPYEASATGLSAYLPGWAHGGSREDLLRRLGDPRAREEMRRDILEGVEDWVSPYRGVGWENTLVTRCSDPDLEGRSVEEIARERGADPFDTAFDLLIENEANVNVVLSTIGEADLERIMAHPAVMIASDSGVSAVEGPLARGKPHPRSFGTFVRVLGEYVRERGVLTLEEAVRKMTTMPAARLGLWDRGVLRVGARADLVIFDPGAVGDRATYTDPFAYPTGVSAVFVNGRETVREGAHLGARAGRILSR